MTLPSKVNKENFRLLDLSSDEESEDLQLEIIPSRKKKITRRERSRGTSLQQPEPNIGAELRCALQWAVRGTLVLWLLMLTWICATLYDQVSTMKPHLENVSKTSSTYNDAIQTCHMDTKEVKGNVTELAQRLKLLETSYNKLADQVNQVTTDLKAVTDQLSAAPKLADTPRKLAELERTVGNMGSQISGFDSTISSWRKQAQATAGTVDELRSKLTEIEVKANETMVNITSHAKLDVDIRTDIAALNNTLSAKVDALETRIQALSKPMSTAAPVPPPVVTPTSTTAAVNVTSTTTTTTLPPGKPAVLH